MTRTATSSFNASAGGGTLASDGELLYVSNGQVIDPSTLTVKYRYAQGGQAVAFDKGAAAYSLQWHLYLRRAQSSFTLTAVEKAIQAILGQIGFSLSGSALDVQRFGTNGLVINTGYSLLFLKSSLVTGSVAPPQLTAKR